MLSVRLFYRLIVRPLLREPWRAALTVFAVALGVSVVLAIELAGKAAAGSFRSSLETLSGNTNLEVTAAGGIPDQTVATLERLPYPIQLHARVEDYTTVADSAQTVPLIGLDLISESNNDSPQSRAFDTVDAENALQYLNDLNSVWVGSRLGYKPGDRIRLLVNDHTREYVVRGIFNDQNEGVRAIVMDIATAQREVGRMGRVDRVLLKVPDEPSIEEWQSRIRDALPSGIEVRLEGSGTAENRKMLSAFRWNLRVLSYIALVVGAFLIYNTISVSVVRRRPEIGIVRALAATRGAILLAFLGEAACFGVAGSLLALPLGRGLASVAVRLLSMTVESLYVSSTPGSAALNLPSAILGVMIGIAVAVVSALSPAREASLVSPVEAMARARREYIARVHKTRDLWIALAMALAAGLASRMPAVEGKPLFGYLSAILLIGASVFAIPAFVDRLSTLSSNLLGRCFGVEALLTSRSLAGSLRRTSVLVGALATAIAMMTAVGIMVGSFRTTVIQWMEGEVPADFYLRPAGSPSVDRHPTIAAELADKLSVLPGVDAVDRLRAYQVSFDGVPTTVAAADLRESRKRGHSDFFSGRPSEEVLKELRSGDAVVVSEPFTYKHNLKQNDSITLRLGTSLATFRIADVYYDYGSERGFILMDRSAMKK